jgi:hypothetical protein
MAHEVRFNLPEGTLGNCDLEIDIWNTKENGEKITSQKLGKLKLSVGEVVWQPRSKSKNIHRMSWEQFALIIENNS